MPTVECAVSGCDEVAEFELMIGDVPIFDDPDAGLEICREHAEEVTMGNAMAVPITR